MSVTHQKRLFFAPVNQPAGPLSDFAGNAAVKLYQARKQQSTRPYRARGIKLQRCETCLMSYCLCKQRPNLAADADFLLIYHRNEILKPTNTGRLIADCFPANTWATEWARNDSCARTSALLNDPDRIPLLLFPAPNSQKVASTALTKTHRRPLFVILDGTWKQAQKMYRQSQWLQALTAIELPKATSNYQLRQAPSAEQLSTSEAVAMALATVGMQQNSEVLANYFTLFSQHYRAMRGNLPNPSASQI